MKKIGIFVGLIDRGAAELLEVNLAKNLTKLGYDVYLITMYSSKLYNDSDIEAKLRDEIPHIIRLGYDLKNNPILLIKNIFRIRNLNLDCIISHNRGTDYFSYIISAGTKTKHIKAFHEYYDKSHIKSLMGKLRLFVIKNADYCYHITQHSMLQNIETFNLDKTKNSVVQNVIDINRKEKSLINIRDLCKIPSKSKIILTVARVAQNKGMELNIEIVIPLLKQDKNLYYIIVGDTGFNVEYYNKILNLVHSNNLEDQILFIGFQKNIAGIMRESDVLLHFARHEAFGLVLVESLYVGLPIVASQVGGIPDVLVKSSFQTFPLEALGKAKEELQKILYQQRKESYNFSSGFETRTSEQRAKEIALIIERVCTT